ncbi:MAG: FUSC family protein [Microbacteriaceae bacterium]|nr:FUSC family protein [Microbacteriaceae bacterium]
MLTNLRSSVALHPRPVLFAVLLVAVAAGVLGLSQALIGPNTATSGYLTLLFLLSIIRANDIRARIFSVCWSIAVALLGFAVGSLGLWVTIVALIVVSLVQGFISVGESMLLTRSPVNLLAFASLSQAGAEVWHVVLGSFIGGAVVLVFAAIMHRRDVHAHVSVPTRDRLTYGIAAALGAVVIVLVAEAVGFPYVEWTLLSFTILLSVGAHERASRTVLRIGGSVAGALIAVPLASLPAPFPMVCAIVLLVFCVAYINEGNYGMFVVCLTPAVLLTTASEYSQVMLGVFRLESVLFATVVALACGAAVSLVTTRLEKRRDRR